MIFKKNIIKTFYLFIFFHLFIWTIIPTISNLNLPLDTIEALAWGSNLDWGYNKHPPFSALAVEVFYRIFGANDWAFYFLSQIFVIIGFFFVWKLSIEIFDNHTFALGSVLILSSIYFYNFTTPEFNVNVSQIPFWALCVYFFWKGVNSNKQIFWVFFGIFSALGFLSKYLFIYLLLSLFIYFILNLKRFKKIIPNYFLSILISLLILIPHLIWLFENNFITIFYGLSRSGLSEFYFTDHFINPIFFILKQLLILTPFLLIMFLICKNNKVKFDLKNKKLFFLISINLIPLLLLLLTSIITGAKIRTMWLTPFYLFLGVLFFELLRKKIEIRRFKRFYYIFIFLFILSPTSYFVASTIDETKRTDYPGKEISRLVQNKWDDNFINDVKIVVGDEWYAGNLSYHLRSRPLWLNDLKNKSSSLKDDEGVIYTGNPKILKKLCPGVFGTIKPVGYCMIGKR